MKISIALGTHNGARFLDEQLRSIAAQDRPPDELVVCDDASSDGTMDMVRRFAAECPWEVRWEVHDRAFGAARNFDRAVSLCCGDVIALCDQDDVWASHKLRRLEEAFEAEPDVGCVFSDAILIDASGRPLPRRLWAAVGFDQGAQQAMRHGRAVEALMRHDVVTGATMAFRASYRDVLSPIPTGWVHDGWFALLMAALAPCRAVPEPLIRYRQHAAQQIGAAQWTLLHQWRRGRRQGRKEFEAIACNYAAAHQRLTEFRSRLRDIGDLRRIEEKVWHFCAKAEMRARPAGRLSLIVRELLCRHYAHYSRGWKSLAQDLFL